MAITRRDFIKTGIALVPTMALMPSVFRRAAAAAAFEQEAVGGKVRTLIIVQMAGGNDPLNTLVPYADNRYYDLRSNLSIADTDVLPLDADVGFHPALANLKNVWDEGRLAVIEGVGYEAPSFSHFSSMDIWQSADPDGSLTDGWLGRYFEELDASQDVLQGLAVGRRLPLEVFSEQVPVPIVESVAGYQLQGDRRYPEAGDARAQALLDLYAAPRQAPYSVLLDNTIQAMHSSSVTLQEVEQAYTSRVEYPETPLAQSLRLLAQAVTSDVGLQVGHVTIGGWDTHANQLADQQTLLETVDQAVYAFYQDIKDHGKEQDVVIMTWSEFGRRARSNASNGTDHGAAGLMFALGAPVTGGLYGARPDLGNLADDNLRYTTDFRSVYATVLERWLGAPAEAILGKGRFQQLGFLPAA